MFLTQVLRGRVQGSLDVSHAVMAVNKKSYRIDLDAGDILYHMKVKVYQLISKLFPSSEKCLISLGQKPRALLHLGDQASSSPLVQEERGGTGPERPPDRAVPLRRRRASSPKRRSGAHSQSQNSWLKLGFGWTLCLLSMSRALPAWWTWLWLQEFHRQPAQQWIKRFRRGCSRLTNQTPALRVKTKINTGGGNVNLDGIHLFLKVIFCIFMLSHVWSVL